MELVSLLLLFLQFLPLLLLPFFILLEFSEIPDDIIDVWISLLAFSLNLFVHHSEFKANQVLI